MSDLPLLEYAPRGPSWTRRMLLRAGVMLCIGVSLAAAGSRWPEVRDRIEQYRRLREFRQSLMTYTMLGNGAVADFVPRDWDRRDGRVNSSGVLCAGFRGVDDELIRHGMCPQLTLLLHGRKDALGRGRLVAVGSDYWTEPTSLQFSVLVMKETEIGDRTCKKLSVGNLVPLTVNRMSRIKVFPGEIDPFDASHFWIRYTADGVEGFIDGYLKDDEAIRWSVRGQQNSPASAVR